MGDTTTGDDEADWRTALLNTKDELFPTVHDFTNEATKDDIPDLDLVAGHAAAFDNQMNTVVSLQPLSDQVAQGVSIDYTLITTRIKALEESVDDGDAIKYERVRRSHVRTWRELSQLAEAGDLPEALQPEKRLGRPSDVVLDTSLDKVMKTWKVKQVSSGGYKVEDIVSALKTADQSIASSDPIELEDVGEARQRS